MARREVFEIDPEEILRHSGFLRRLARGLVGDEHASEDLVQEAWAAALASPPRAGSPAGLRAWLAQVVRRRASNRAREEVRRKDREWSAARSEDAAGLAQGPHGSGSGGAGVDRELELQSRVLQAVLALREPYKSAVFMRYFRDMPSKDIARELGVPVATVDTRLTRGRALLREKLSRDFGSRRAWMLALLPLSVPSSSSGSLLAAAPTAGAWIVGTKLKIALLVLIPSVLFATWKWTAFPEPLAVEPSAPRVVEAARDEPLARPDAVDVDRWREVVAESEAEERSPAQVVSGPIQPPAAGLRLYGSLLGLDGHGLPGVQVLFRHGDGAPAGATDLRVRTDARGSFVIPGVLGAGRVSSDDEGLVTVLFGGYAGEEQTPETTVVAAPGCRMQVSVVDDSGAPLDDVAVTLAVPDEFRSRFAVHLETSADAKFRGRTGEEGEVAFARVPAIPGALLSAHRKGFAPERFPLGADVFGGAAVVSQRVVLESLESRSETLAGYVLDEIGSGVEGADVTYRTLETRTDETGRFLLDLGELAPLRKWFGEAGAEHDVIAVRRGFLPATLRPGRDVVTGEPLWPETIYLQPAELPLSLSGRVVNELGEPLEGYLVFLPEARLFRSNRTLEGALAGSEGFVHAVRSGAGGRFELGGLLDREYDLAAVDEATLLRGDVRGVRAGDRGVTLRVDTSRIWERVEGRVLDSGGQPVAGVVVEPYVTTQVARGARGFWRSSLEGEATQTDEEGRFVLRGIPMEGVELGLESPDIIHRDGIELSELRGAGTGDEPLDLILEATMRLRFQVVLDDPSAADALRVLDASGDEMYLYTQTANSYVVRGDNNVIAEGRSRHVFVEENATTLLLLKGGVEVRRLPLDLPARTETLLRL